MLKPSWDDTCEASLSQRWQTTRRLYSDSDNYAARDEIETAWHDRLDRLYLNTAMPESTYKKFLRLADQFFMKKYA